MPRHGSRLLLAGAAALLLAACGSTPKKSAHTTHHHATPQSASVSRPRPAAPTYTVKPGDTLYSIAFRNQIDFHDLANWNDIGRDYLIHVGQTLRLAPPGGSLPSVAGGAPDAVSATASSDLPASAPAPKGSSSTSRATPSPQPRPASAPLPPLNGNWQWPLNGPILQRFSADDDAKGIDIGGDEGQPVLAAAPGKVVYSGSALKGYGELVIIKHSEDYLSAYGYNRKRLVEEGQQVAAGQAVAEVGQGPQQKAELHFEIRYKGQPLDPLALLPGR